MKRKSLSTKLSKLTKKDLSNWDEAILEATERIRTLKRSIRTFVELRDSGMPWPGTAQSLSGITDNSSESSTRRSKGISATRE